MLLVIPPTTGRRVLLFLGGTEGVLDASKPFDAGIAYVWSEGKANEGDPLAPASLINVGYCDHAGIAKSATSVRLYDRPQNANDKHGGEAYAVWMPYQFEQAMRAQNPPALVNPALARPGDVELVKLEDNGEPVAGAGILPRADDLGADATGEQLRASYEYEATQEANEQAAGQHEGGDGGVLEGTNRTTSGAIGQP